MKYKEMDAVFEIIIFQLKEQSFLKKKKKKSGGMEHIKEQVKTEKKKKSVLTCNMIFLQCQ